METLVGFIIMGMTLLMFGSIMLFYIAIFGFLTFVIIIWIMMIVDVVKRKFPTESDRLTWVLVVILAGWIGALVYYFVIKRPEDLKLKV